MEPLPAGAAHFLQSREVCSAVAPFAGIAAALTVGWLGTEVLDLPRTASSGVFAGVIMVAIVFVGYRVFLWFSTVVLDTLGARREVRTALARQDWARRYGWAFDLGPRPIDPAAAAVAMPARSEPDRAVRTLGGRIRGRPAQIQTWLVRRPRNRRRYVRGDKEVRFRPILANVVLIHTDTPLPRVGFFPSAFLGVEHGPPPVLTAAEVRAVPGVPLRGASPDVPIEAVMDQIGAHLRRFDRPAVVRVIAAGHTLAVTVFKEPEIDAVARQLDILSDIADALEQFAAAGPGAEPGE